MAELGIPDGGAPPEIIPFTGNEQPTADPLMQPGALDVAPQPPASHPAFTDEDALAELIPFYSRPSADSSSPADSTPKPGESSSLSVGAGGKAFSPERYQQVRGADGDLRRDQANIAVGAQNQMGAIGGLFDQANENAREAIRFETESQLEHDKQLAIENGKLAQYHREFATAEQEESAKASALVAQSRADYLAALQDYRASGVNPGQLFQGMGGFDQVGTLAVAFVSDFLGAGGIKTSGMASVNQAIDRNIDAQVNGIKVKGQVAEGFKTLWDMQRAQSASEAEARARVKGFMLDAFKAEVEAHMGSFRSGLVQAKGMAAIAKLDAEQAKNLFEVWKHVDASANAKSQQALQLHIAKLNNAQEAWRNSIAASQAALAVRKAQREAANDAIKDLIPDPTQTGGGAMRWIFRPGISDSAKDEVLKRVEAAARMTANVREYRQMLDTHDSINDLAAKTRFASTNSRKMRELQLKILGDEILLKSGKAATEPEAKRIEARVPLDTAFTNADVAVVISGFEKHGLEDLQKGIGTYTYDLPENDPRRQIKGAQGQFGVGEYTEAKLRHENKPEVRSTTDNAVSVLTSPQGAFTDASTDMRDQILQLGGNLREEWQGYRGPLARRGGIPVVDQENLHRGGDDAMPAYASAIVAMRLAADQGDKKARAQLEMWAGAGDQQGGPMQVLPNGTDANTEEGNEIRSFARYQWNKLKEAPSK